MVSEIAVSVILEPGPGPLPTSTCPCPLPPAPLPLPPGPLPLCSLFRGLRAPASVILEPGPAPSKELFTVSLSSDAPLRQFLVLRHEHLVVEAAAGLGAVLDKLQLYRHRVSMAFEVLHCTGGSLCRGFTEKGVSLYRVQ